MLERITGGPVTHLAYPFGAFDETTIAAAAEAGLTHAFTCEPRALAAGDAPLRLPRLDPQEHALDRFAARVLLALDSSARLTRAMVQLHVTSAGNEFMAHIAGLFAEGFRAQGIASEVVVDGAPLDEP